MGGVLFFSPVILDNQRCLYQVQIFKPNLVVMDSSSSSILARAKIPAQFLLLRRRNKKQRAENGFEGFLKN